jgi:adenylylsulfate kinase-like enzyme
MQHTRGTTRPLVILEFTGATGSGKSTLRARSVELLSAMAHP